MTTRTLTSVLFAALLFAAGRADAQFAPRNDGPENYHVELGVMFWKPTPELTLTSGGNPTVDFVEQFKFSDEQFREFRATLKPGRKHKLLFSYIAMEYDKDAVISGFSYNGTTFPANINATADIKWDILQGGYEWDFLSKPQGFLGVVGQLKYSKVTADVSASSQVQGQAVTLSTSTEQTAPVPTIGAAGRGYIGKYASIGGTFTFFKYDNEKDFHAKFYDYDFYGAAHFGKHLGAQVGYRTLDIDFLVDNGTGTMKPKGPYFGGFLRF